MSEAVLSLRPIEPSDEEFLLRVYAGTREEELALVPWSDEEKQAFVRMQFDAQHAYYQEHYAGASFDVVLADQRPVGRLYVARWEDEIRIVDIALLPEERAKGIGTRVLRQLLAEAADAGKPLSIHVEKMNRARALYERLGFEEVADRDVYVLMKTRPERRLDRRGFVKLTAAGAALMLAGPLAGTAWAAARTRLTIGVLAPTGGGYALMGDSLVRGLQLALPDARLVVRGVERGYAGAHGTTAALLEEGVDLLVAGVTAPVAELVSPLVNERRTPLVVANVGGHVVRPRERDAYVLHNSLLFWQSAYAAGLWGAKALGRRAVLATSPADAGYDAIYAFRRAFERAGGAIVDDVVTDAPAELVEAVRAARPDFVYASFCGAEARDVLRAYGAAGLRRRVPVVTTSFATEDYALRALGRTGVGTRSVASWTRSRQTPANQAFVRAFREAAGRPADPFAALGYDTGLLIAAGIARAGRPSRLIDALAGAEVDGPRGRLTVDPRTNSVSGPLALRTVRRTPTRLANVELGWSRRISAFPRALAPLAAAPASGYVNEYLCP